jgi:hypothetical protein
MKNALLVRKTPAAIDNGGSFYSPRKVELDYASRSSFFRASLRARRIASAF